MNSFAPKVIWSLIPTFAMVAGGGLTLIKPINDSIRSMILHFAAGVVFSVVSVELLPDIIKRHAPIQIIIGFSLGIATMLALRTLSRRAEKAADEQTKTDRLPVSFLFGILIDIIVDGLLLGIGFATTGPIGTMLTIALSVELFALGLAVSASLQAKLLSKKRTFYLVGICSSIFIIASIASSAALRILDSNNLEIVLSFSLAALLFLVTEELLVEAHTEEETPFHTACFFLGFLALFILDLLSK